MIPLATLKAGVQRGLKLLSRLKDVAEAEIYASATAHALCRINYTSAIPCQGVEEPKSTETFGIGVRAVFKDGSGHRIGVGSEARDLSPNGIRRAIEKARQNAVPDPDFVALPGPADRESGRASSGLARYHDRAIMDLKDGALVEAGWTVIREALQAFTRSDALLRLAGSKEGVPRLGLIVGGHVSLLRQRVAVASMRLPRVQTDESTLVSALITAMIERHRAKGSGYAATTHLAKFKGEAGAEAARHAIATVDGQRLPTGAYTVVLGPQPVADLMANVILPSLRTDTFYSGRSAFLGELGRRVAPEFLSLADLGAAKGLAGSRAVTCEGLPTGRTDLIRGGFLRGLLSNHYETQRLLRDPRAREKLGLNPQDHPECVAPRNGFRLSGQGGRHFDAPLSIAPTNVVVETATPHTMESLLRLVGNGVYIGRIWYTYAINGLRAGDFTCTVVGDSYLIQDGRLGTPLRPNTIRITANIRHLLTQIIGVTRQTRPIIGWAADEVVYAPEIAVRELGLTEIAQFTESV